MYKLSASARERLNDPALIAQRDLWLDRLRALFDGAYDPYNAEHVFTISGGFPRSDDPMLLYTHPEAWVYECLERFAAQEACSADRFSPESIFGQFFGTHFIDRMFGAEVFLLDGEWNSHYISTPVGELRMPDLETDETWSLARRAACAFLDADVKVPFFGLPVLSSPLNIFVNLYGQEGLIAMLEDEEAALHDLHLITELIRTLHRWYIAHIPAQQLQCVLPYQRTQPPGFGQICGCTTQLLSGSLYREVIAPLDDSLFAEYPHGGMIHLCGGHTQHIEVFRDMPHLRAVQLNDRAAGDLKHYLAGLRQDQILYVRPCKEMPLEKMLELTGGERLVIQAPIDAPKKAR